MISRPVRGDDSGLVNVWEELKYQVQREESFSFDAYIDVIEQICNEKLDNHHCTFHRILWTQTDVDSCLYSYYDDNDEDELPGDDEIFEAVVTHIRNTVLEVAENEDLLFDPDDVNEDDDDLEEEPEAEVKPDNDQLSLF